jgi:hypothetical protein
MFPTGCGDGEKVSWREESLEFETLVRILESRRGRLGMDCWRIDRDPLPWSDLCAPVNTNYSGLAGRPRVCIRDSRGSFSAFHVAALLDPRLSSVAGAGLAL